MKNLMIYVSPKRDFGNEEKVTIKIQIENSLDLGWKKEDIMLITNFPYEYKDVRAITVSDDNYAPFFPPVTKITTILDLFEKGLFEKGQLYWFHDLDVFQNEVITEEELGLDSVDIGLCDKGRMPRWGTGSVFFKESSKDIFYLIKQVAYKYKINEEPAFNALTSNNLVWATEAHPEEFIGNRFVPANIPGSEDINDRIKKLNISYNFAGWNIRSCYKMAVKPIKVVHFHPFDPVPYFGINVLDYFMYGKNKLGVQFVPDRLIKILNKHGIR